MKTQRFSYHDLVLYAVLSKKIGMSPRIGYYSRTDEDGRLVIVPLKGGQIVKRQINEVIKFATIFYEHKKEILHQVEAL